MTTRKTAFEEMLPHELEAVVREAPVAYIPLGTFEHHGRHMPIGNDAIKAAALCRLLAERTGGVVLPPLFYGTGGGHLQFAWTIMIEDPQLRHILRRTLEKLHEFGFRVLVVLTGHYPGEQTNLIKEVGAEVEADRPGLRVIALPEYEAYAEREGDHAAKWETSILMELRPDLVQMDRLGPKPDQPGAHRFHNDNPEYELYAIAGEDPRHFASPELGKRTVREIVDTLAGEVTTALRATAP